MKSFSQRLWTDAPTINTVSELEALILKLRGFENRKNIQSFFHPTLSDLTDPNELSGMKDSVERIIQAVENKERIIVFGDFDADGITSTVVLVKALQNIGAIVSYRIPERNIHSHGLKNSFINEVKEKGVSLIITVDCGINDAEEVSHAKNLNIDVIITDHHEPDPKRTPTDAFAIINHHQDANFSHKLSGSATALKLAMALLAEVYHDPQILAEKINPLFEIAAIGVVADCVPLVGENRIIAKFGLENMKNSGWDGLLKIFSENDIDTDEISEETIGFTIAPRLNAASRIGDVIHAVQLFLGNHQQNFQRIAQLETWNNERKKRTEEAVKHSRKQIEKGVACQVLMNDDWSPGILGLVAARHVEHLGVPVVACTIREDGKLCGSARAPENVSMIEGLHAVADLLGQFGGHDGAGGFVADKKDLQSIRKNIQKHYTKKKFKISKIPIEAWISPKELNDELLSFLNAFGPFGMGHPAPIFGFQNFIITQIFPMGADKNHFRFSGTMDGIKSDIVAFFAGHLEDKVRLGQSVDVAFTVKENYWKGKRRIQLRVVDMRENL